MGAQRMESGPGFLTAALAEGKEDPAIHAGLCDSRAPASVWLGKNCSCWRREEDAGLRPSLLRQPGLQGPSPY